MERRLEAGNAETTIREDLEPLPMQHKAPRFGVLDKIVIVLVLGAIIGVVASKAYYERRLEEAITLQRFIHKNVIYEISELKHTANQ